MYTDVILCFLLGSFVGWLWEYAIDGVPNYNFDIKLPFLFVYGVGLILIRSLYSKIWHYNIIIRSIIYVFVLTILEYVISKISYLWHGYYTWSYENNRQISLNASMVWLIFALLAEKLFINPFQSS